MVSISILSTILKVAPLLLTVSAAPCAGDVAVPALADDESDHGELEKRYRSAIYGNNYRNGHNYGSHQAGTYGQAGNPYDHYNPHQGNGYQNTHNQHYNQQGGHPNYHNY